MIRSEATSRGVAVDTVGERRIDALAGDDRQHQGVVAAATAPTPWSLDAFMAQRTGREWNTQLLVLDHVHNPANVGMILRTAAGAGLHGVVLPEQGTASIGPLTVKAGSGLIFAVPIIVAETTGDALHALLEGGFAIYGLDSSGESMFTADLSERAAYVMGNETVGLSADVRDIVTDVLSLPLANGVESLNVAAAAAVVSYELVRRRG